MDHMSRKFFLILLPLISGCVYTPHEYHTHNTTVVQYEHSSSTDDHTSVVTTKEEVIQKVLPTPKKYSKDTSKKCMVFELPRKKPVPPTPIITEFIETPEQIDILLTDYIKELKSHIVSERAKIEQAYEEWRAKCDE